MQAHDGRNPYDDATFEASQNALVRTIVAVVTAAMADSPRTGRVLAHLSLQAIDALYEEARDPRQMSLLIGVRNEIAAASSPLPARLFQARAEAGLAPIASPRPAHACRPCPARLQPQLSAPNGPQR
jgi:hypothetical protein